MNVIHITAGNSKVFDKKINTALSENEIEPHQLIDIKYSVITLFDNSIEPDIEYSALIIYKQ